jgi:hypothetical protein
MLLNCSTCFERHAAHNQELKTVIAASGFTYICGCQQLSWLSGNWLQPLVLHTFVDAGSCHGWMGTDCSLWFYICLWLPAAVMAEWELSAASGSTYVCDCWQLSWLSGNWVPTQPWQLPTTTNVCKLRGCNYSFELLMMSGVSLEHVEQLSNIGIINSTTKSHLVGYIYKIYVMMHGCMNIWCVEVLFLWVDILSF